MTKPITCPICNYRILTGEEEEKGMCERCQKKKHAETFVERVIRLGEEGIKDNEG